MIENHAKLAAVIVALVALLAAAPTTVRAQSAPRLVHNSDRRVSEMDRETTKKARDPKEALAEINEDLRRLNELNEGVTATLGANSTPINYLKVVEDVGEIKKRATRLKSTLALPADQKEEKSAGYKDAEKAELQLAMTELNKLLNRFLHNPIFSDSGPLDMRLAAQARRDLEDIVVLSEKVRKNAEKRGKSAAKTP